MFFFFFQAEDGIRDRSPSRGLGDVYKRQGHLFAIAAQKSVDYGYDGYVYGFAANKELLDHYVQVFNGEVIGVLHPYQFAIDESNAKKIMEVYDYDWTDEEV